MKTPDVVLLRLDPDYGVRLMEDVWLPLRIVGDQFQLYGVSYDELLEYRSKLAALQCSTVFREFFQSGQVHARQRVGVAFDLTAFRLVYRAEERRHRGPADCSDPATRPLPEEVDRYR